MSRFAGLRQIYLGIRGHQILRLVAVDGFNIHVWRSRCYAGHSSKKSGAKIVNLAGLRREMRGWRIGDGTARLAHSTRRSTPKLAATACGRTRPSR